MKLEKILPEYLIKQSLVFKTMVIIVGAILLLFSTIIRETYSVLWIIPFLAGALVEWLIVATVYVELNRAEREIKQAKSDAQSALNEIETKEKEIRQIQREIEATKEDIFGFSSDSKRLGSSIEDRVEHLENIVGTRNPGRGTLCKQVKEIRRELDEIRRRR